MPLVLLQALAVLSSTLVLALTIRAIIKGPNYIAESNLSWDRISLFYAIRKKELGRYFKKITPFAMMITFIWAGYSIAYNFFWFLGDAGYIDREYDEWKSYRSHLSSVIGGGLGLVFCNWLLSVCERVRIASARDQIDHNEN